MDIVRIELSDLCIMDNDEVINKERIAFCFLKGSRVVYFLSNGELIGILTIVDYNKNRDINKNYTYIDDSFESFSKAQLVFKKTMIRD